jgi:hypothetical protein
MVPSERENFDRQKITETLLHCLIVPFLFQTCYPAIDNGRISIKCA